MPDLTDYQIHELIMEDIAERSPGCMPARIIVSPQMFESTGIPEGTYSPAGQDAMWIRTGDVPKPADPDYCCEMRRHFVLGIVGTNGPEPTDVASFAIAWEPKIILAPLFCSWCGEKFREKSTRRVTGL